MQNNKILIGCTVKEKNLEYANLETEYLFRTIDKFGDNLNAAKKIACFTEKPDSLLKEILENMQVQIRITDELDNSYPEANALLILEEGIKEDVDIIVMLDTDIVIAKDFSELLSTTKILIKPEDSDPFTLEEWKKLFDYFEIPFPKERFYTSCSGQKTIPYFNGGVIIIPKFFATELLEQWKFFVKQILSKKNNLPQKFIEKIRFTGQIAFSLALLKLELPYGPLPLSMNYPYSGYVHEREHPERLDPYIIHYHHSILENSDLMYCPYDNVNSKIDKINEYLKNVRKIKIDKEYQTSVISIRNLTMINEFEKVIDRLSNLKLDDPNPNLQYYLALSLHNTKINLDEALIRYNKALEFGFDPFMVYFDRGWLYYNLGDNINAKHDFENASNLKPYDKETKKRLSLLDPTVEKIKLLYDAKKFQDVIKTINDLSIDDENPYLQYYLAVSLHATKTNLDEALIRYNKALEFGFEPFWIFFYRRLLHIELGHLKDAKDDLLKSYTFNTDSYNFHDVLSQVIKDKDAHLEQVIKDKDAHLEQVIKDKDAHLEQVIKDYKNIIKQIKQSKSWRLTHLFNQEN